MRFDTLDEWLDWQSGLHPSAIDLGLERVASVWRRLHPTPFPCPVISVAGTNGKGSCVAFAEAILSAAGYRVGSYTSPHLRRYNERIRVAREEVDDARICRAFERIDQARGATSLTYFEFGTLAALDIFAAAGLDAVVLEVGLGGRLDAVNIIDADVALI
ncbi:MAG: bifunctional folylpolyglutamate synthase/dihydrofolate synthase, partial [Candidatus Sedimenticola endophacoides]